jgi:peptidyl-dipeptidase Dcp
MVTRREGNGVIRSLSKLATLGALAMTSACTEDRPETQGSGAGPSATDGAMQTDNPFFSESPLPFGYPQFDRIENDDYLPAFEAGMAEQLEEVAAIANQSTAPTVANTLIPLERSGQLLNRVSAVFSGLIGAHTNDTLDQIQAEISPRLADHRDQILLNEQLFARIKALHDTRESLGLDRETLRLIEETHRDFVRSGAELSVPDKDRLRRINAELAELNTRFTQNVLREVNALAIVVDSPAELAGLSEAQLQTAADAASDRELPGRYVLPLLNTTQQPPLASLENRALRERILETAMNRGSRGGEFDNRDIVARTARLRAELAELLGYPNYAAYVLEEQTARTVAAVNEHLASLTPPAVANARREATDLQRLIAASGEDFELAAWDWAYYAERLRRQRYAFDEEQLKPYFELDRVLRDGVFFAANRLYGVTFEERFDLPVYEETVRVFDVFDRDGAALSIFLFDPYARASKRGGAWANRYVEQSRLMGTRTVVGNHINIAQPPEGEPTLLTFTEVNTMFHEFGHALHGMFSDVVFPSFSGTRVPRDFVEYPSQVNEMWAIWPAVLSNYARHFETDEPMPQELLQRVIDAENFNQGYATTENLAASIIDQAIHQLAAGDVPSGEQLMQFEAAALAIAGANLPVVPPRYRYPYFSHIMGGYAAGYYSYIWSEVLDADTVEWFKENGGLTQENGQHFRDTLLSRGGSEDAMIQYRAFRGRDPEVQPLLQRRGLN